VAVDGSPSGYLAAEGEPGYFFSQERRGVRYRKGGRFPLPNDLFKSKLTGRTPYHDLLHPVGLNLRQCCLRKLGGTAEVAGPMLDDATAKPRAADRGEVQSEGLKHVDDLIG
jgi:hypothetical protein